MRHPARAQIQERDRQIVALAKHGYSPKEIVEFFREFRTHYISVILDRARKAGDVVPSFAAVGRPGPLTAARLRELLDYDPITGVFRWLVDRGGQGGGSLAGAVAGHIGDDGYFRIGVDGDKYRSNRLAWLYMAGEWPKGEIDHRNLDPLDNRWSNLRDATVSQNRINKSRQKSNKSGFKGVHWHSAVRKWAASIQADGQRFHLGLFATPEEAHAAYVAASGPLHGEFARAS